ncbi:hypothetical protein [Aeromicrobium fastidiosum]|uniref:Uncharacterized protein n=1 Tax=Aeromicrobium fastidiosum TaxID=52699 RepID=A0A641ATD1_9ACTN|nr:hypothetical protein [Aeromicrobium fastidiosum]KAA1380493.1 hypothetical protein ESP62_004760 [Aeromicrobium fastidiosum]MBP2390083.1 hypothetical protein [Aeromicrobium fastidiosum]
MAKIDDKFAATLFTVGTNLSFEQVLAAADDVAERSAGLITKIHRDETDAEEGFIAFHVKKGGFAKVGAFAVTYAPPDDTTDTGTVTFLPGTYLTSRATVLLIPIGPADSAALKPFQTFSRLLKQSVSDEAAA